MKPLYKVRSPPAYAEPDTYEIYFGMDTRRPSQPLQFKRYKQSNINTRILSAVREYVGAVLVNELDRGSTVGLLQPVDVFVRPYQRVEINVPHIIASTPVNGSLVGVALTRAPPRADDLFHPISFDFLKQHELMPAIIGLADFLALLHKNNMAFDGVSLDKLAYGNEKFYFTTFQSLVVAGDAAEEGDQLAAAVYAKLVHEFETNVSPGKYANSTRLLDNLRYPDPKVMSSNRTEMAIKHGIHSPARQRIGQAQHNDVYNVALLIVRLFSGQDLPEEFSEDFFVRLYKQFLKAVDNVGDRYQELMIELPAFLGFEDRGDSYTVYGVAFSPDLLSRTYNKSMADLADLLNSL
jgi:hypothetical protein